jgi:molybdopterin/thiamine biosynthesis adenylyltransferase
MNLRITEAYYREMRRLTAASFLDGVEFPPETGCILLLGRNDHPANPALLVAGVLTPGEGELVEQEHDGLVFSSSYLRRALLYVRKHGLAGFLTVHTHPLADDRVGFSWYDDGNDPELMANLYDLQPEGVFGSVVLGKRSAAGRVWSRDGREHEMFRDLIVVGEGLQWIPLNGEPLGKAPVPAEIFDRSLALTGSGALACLSKLRVGVVGGSGTGSLVVELLVRAGVGEVLIFEFDKVKDHNLNRILHSRRRDAESQVNKAARLADAGAETEMPTRVIAVPGGDIRDPETALELRGCDAVFGCVDRDWARLILCEFSQQYLIPYIDLGTEIGVGTDGVQSLDSRVSYVAPGRPCLLCSGIVSTERVRLEGLGDEELERVIGMGYSDDIRLVAPAVMDLNMRGASYGMLLLRHLLQPFLDTPVPTHIKESLTNYSIKAVRREGQPECPVCGVKERTGCGSSRRLTTR